MVQWLGIHASTAGGKDSVPGWGTNILHAAWDAARKKKSARLKKEENIKQILKRSF